MRRVVPLVRSMCITSQGKSQATAQYPRASIRTRRVTHPARTRPEGRDCRRGFALIQFSLLLSPRGIT